MKTRLFYPVNDEFSFVISPTIGINVNEEVVAFVFGWFFWAIAFEFNRA